MKISYILFSCSGRINRQRYWIGFLQIIAFMILPLMLLFAVSGAMEVTAAVNNDTSSAPGTLFKAIATIITIIIFGLMVYSSLALRIKRLHDMNSSGWLCLLTFIPLVGIIFTIVIGCIEGTVGANKYGADPLLRTPLPPQTPQV